MNLTANFLRREVRCVNAHVGSIGVEDLAKGGEIASGPCAGFARTFAAVSR